ncbi:MAG: radical SAM protein [bacterium]|nr:radical SAM protein [bacterium]
MIPQLKNTVELRRTSHCVIMRDTKASASTERELAPLEAVVLALCDGSRDVTAIAGLLPETLAKEMSVTIEQYVRNVLERNKNCLNNCEIPISGSNRYNPADFLFIPKRQSDTGRYRSPINATLLLTYRCNFHCVYCYNNSGPAQSEQLGTSDWLEVIRQLSEETDCQSIYLSGGEPLIHPGFFEILAAGRRAGMMMDFTTNGSLIDDEAVQRLVDLGIGYVRVSLDSPYAKMHHQLTQTKDTFEKVTHAIEAMAKAGITLGTKGILYDGNYKDAEELTRFAHSLGATDVMLDAYDCSNIGRGKSDITMSEEHYAVVEKHKEDIGYTIRNNRRTV